MSLQPATTTSLLARLAQGPVICAEGYLFELERRGYVTAGPFVPDVVLEHPEAVTTLHREFVRAGSDVVEAFTYYAHREKLRLVGREHLLERMNRQALRLAREVAQETGTMFAGNICNTNVFEPTDRSRDAVRAMFREQVAWAAQEGAEFIVGETFSYTEEAVLACEAIKAVGLPAVMTLAVRRQAITRDGDTPAEACRKLEAAGADVVGLNCIRGPQMMLELLPEVRQAVRVPVAALPVPYRTTPEQPSFQSLTDPGCSSLPNGQPFPTALDPFTCNRYEIAEFAGRAHEIGVNYLGLCCGAGPHHIRSLAQALGKTPESSRHDPDMSKHAFLGTDESLLDSNRAFKEDL